MSQSSEMTEREIVESGACRTCLDAGFHCYPHSSNRPEVECPGEVCATCDYTCDDDEIPKPDPFACPWCGGHGHTCPG